MSNVIQVNFKKAKKVEAFEQSDAELSRRIAEIQASIKRLNELLDLNGKGKKK